MRARIAIIIVAVLAIAAPAQANEYSAAHGLDLAAGDHREHPCAGKIGIYWTDGPGLDRVDSSGRTVRPSGKAVGLEYIRGSWRLTSCSIMLRRGMSPAWTCKSALHEAKHLYLLQVKHTGELAYGRGIPEECRRSTATRRHRWYHTRSKHSRRVALAIRWHRIAEAR